MTIFPAFWWHLATLKLLTIVHFYLFQQTLLTSGQVPNAYDGKALIKQLVEQANNRIIIMPGSGVRSNNIAALATYTGATELHSSARKLQSSGMLYTKESMQENLDNINVDEEEIMKMKQALQSIAI